MLCHMANISGEIDTINKTPAQRTQCAQAYTVFELTHHITCESFCHSHIVLSLISLPYITTVAPYMVCQVAIRYCKVTTINKNIGGYTNDGVGVHCVLYPFSLATKNQHFLLYKINHKIRNYLDLSSDAP